MSPFFEKVERGRETETDIKEDPKGVKLAAGTQNNGDIFIEAGKHQSNLSKVCSGE